MKNTFLFFFFLSFIFFSSCKKDDTIKTGENKRVKIRTFSNIVKTEYQYSDNKIVQVIATRPDKKVSKQEWKYAGEKLTIDLYNTNLSDEWTYSRSLIINYNNGKISQSHFMYDDQIFNEKRFTWNGDLLLKVEYFSSDTVSRLIEYKYNGTQLDSAIYYDGMGNREFSHEYTYLNGKVTEILIEESNHKIEVEYAQDKLSKVSDFLIMVTGELNLIQFEEWSYDDSNKKIIHSRDYIIEYEEGGSNLKDYSIVTNGWPCAYLSDEINESFFLK